MTGERAAIARSARTCATVMSSKPWASTGRSLHASSRDSSSSAAPRPHPGPVGQAERIEGGAVARDEVEDLGEAIVAGRMRRLPDRGQLAGQAEQRVDEPREPGRRREHRERRLADDAHHEEPSLHVARDRAKLAAAAQHLLEQVVERDDRAAEKDAPVAQKLALERLDVGPVGDDEQRIGARVHRLEEPRAEECDLAAVGGSTDERERHRWILRPRPIRPGHAEPAGQDRSSMSTNSQSAPAVRRTCRPVSTKPHRS